MGFSRKEAGRIFFFKKYVGHEKKRGYFSWCGSLAFSTAAYELKQ
jgi:hypothetical protein